MKQGKNDLTDDKENRGDQETTVEEKAIAEVVTYSPRMPSRQQRHFNDCTRAIQDALNHFICEISGQLQNIEKRLDTSWVIDVEPILNVKEAGKKVGIDIASVEFIKRMEVLLKEMQNFSSSFLNKNLKDFSKDIADTFMKIIQELEKTKKLQFRPEEALIDGLTQSQKEVGQKLDRVVESTIQSQEGLGQKLDKVAEIISSQQVVGQKLDQIAEALKNKSSTDHNDQIPTLKNIESLLDQMVSKLDAINEATSSLPVEEIEKSIATMSENLRLVVENNLQLAGIPPRRARNDDILELMKLFMPKTITLDQLLAFLCDHTIPLEERQEKLREILPNIRPEALQMIVEHPNIPRQLKDMARQNRR